MTISWVWRPLWVNQLGQLSLPSLRVGKWVVDPCNSLGLRGWRPLNSRLGRSIAVSRRPGPVGTGLASRSVCDDSVLGCDRFIAIRYTKVAFHFHFITHIAAWRLTNSNWRHGIPVRPWIGPAYLTDALQPVAKIRGRQRLRPSSTSVLDVPCRRPSVSRFRGTNMEEFASRSDAIKFHANLLNQTKITFSLEVVPIVSDLL